MDFVLRNPIHVDDKKIAVLFKKTNFLWIFPSIYNFSFDISLAIFSAQSSRPHFGTTYKTNLNGNSSSRNVMHRPTTNRQRTVEFIQVVSILVILIVVPTLATVKSLKSNI